MQRTPQKAATGKGVIVKDAHIQIDLRTAGYGKERLNLAPTPANIRYAEKLRNEILGKVERGTFALIDYFPDSPRVKRDAPSLLFKDLANEWLSIKSKEVQHSTAHHYEQTVNSYHFDEWRDMPVLDFDFRTTKLLLSKLPTNAKTFNNIATVVRQIFEYGHLAKLLAEPIHELVEMRKRQGTDPDPFTLEEVEIFLNSTRSEIARDYYEIAFFTGMRPSEQIALRIGAIDKRRDLLHVTEALTRGEVKGTKTLNTRDVELSDRALHAIARQLERRKGAGAQERLFLDNYGNPLAGTDNPLNQWWTPAIKASGLRKRDARQTRHTFATICLMGGIKPAWAAGQMGHSVEMFYRVYSKWIEGADKGAERGKLNAILGQTGTKTGTNIPN